MKKLCYHICFVLFGMLCASSFAQTRHPATTAKTSGTALRAQIAAGQKVYTLQCLPCHQADGGGVQNMNPPLIKTTYVLGDKSKIIQIVLKGFNGQVPINGDTYSNVMPSLSILTDQEVADVLTFVRNSFGNKASVINPAEVTKIRTTLK